MEVLGKLPPRKIAPSSSPNSNANPKPNPHPDRGGDFPDTHNRMVITYFIFVRERLKWQRVDTVTFYLRNIPTLLVGVVFKHIDTT